MRGLKRLDLSDNHIGQLEVQAFAEIGHSLQSLKMSHGLASKMTALSPEVMQDLTSLQELDVSNNHLKTLSETCFHFVRNLRVLEMHDNQLDQVAKGTFQVGAFDWVNGFCNIEQRSQLEFMNNATLYDLFGVAV